MDEHILVEGDPARFEGEIVDDNLSSLTWWTEKHNAHASREVVDLPNLNTASWPTRRWPISGAVSRRA